MKDMNEKEKSIEKRKTYMKKLPKRWDKECKQTVRKA